MRTNVNLFNRVCDSSAKLETQMSGCFMIRPSGSRSIVAIDYICDETYFEVIDGAWFNSVRQFKTWAKQFRD